MRYLAFVCLLGGILVSNGQTTTQQVTATAGKYLWETSANWTNSIPTGSPTAITNANVDITVAAGNEIWTSTGLTFANNGTNSDKLIVNGTLIIQGSVFFAQNSLELQINSGGILVVIGNLTNENKASVANGGQLLITGNFTLNGGNITYDDGNGGTDNLWVGGTIGGSNSQAVSDASADDEPDLNSGTFPPNIVSIIEGILPVDLVSFKSKITGSDQVSLNWNTASELNNDYFSIQRSENGTDFYEIGRVTGHGTTNIPQSYSFTDNEPLSTIEYYRLKQIDFDGVFEIHPTIVVFLDQLGKQLSVETFPNPVVDKINIKPSRAMNISQFILLDMMGKMVVDLKETTTKNGVIYEASLPELKKGLYQLVMTSADGQKVTKRIFIR